MNRPDWNDRYSRDEFVYGKEPNTFLQEHAQRLSGPILSLAEGEGRNAVYLASQGFEVLGIDSSEVGLTKAQNLARERGVVIQTEVADLADYLPPPDAFGSIVSIWAHLPSNVRARLYPRLMKSLRPGGWWLMEAYSHAQLERDTGGPKDRDLLMTVELVRHELPDLEVVLLQETLRDVTEGAFHTGVASVVQLFGRKRVTRHE